MSEALLGRCRAAELELEAKGYNGAAARAAVAQARNWSLTMARRVRPELREQVALDLLEDRLRQVESDYLKGYTAAARRPDNGERFADGLGKAGFTVGPETRRAYAAGMRAVVDEP